MKPGYSRFDEGDLLAFYLVRQLIKVGFTPAEVGPVILSMTEKNHEFVSSLRKRAHDLNARRVAIDEKLASLERLEEAMLVPGTVAHVCGMRVLNLGGFEAALADAREKQVMWARLKKIPPLGEPF